VISLRLDNIRIRTVLFASGPVRGGLGGGKNRHRYFRHGWTRSNDAQELKPVHARNIEIQQEQLRRVDHSGDRFGSIFSVGVVFERECNSVVATIGQRGYQDFGRSSGRFCARRKKVLTRTRCNDVLCIAKLLNERSEKCTRQQ
jgi:hypothetical protein